MRPRQYSTGVSYLDTLLGGLLHGDNIVWQVDSGAPVEFFIRSFLETSAQDDGKVVFVSFSHSPQAIVQRYVTDELRGRFHLVDAFTSGFGRGDDVFAGFYRNSDSRQLDITRVDEPSDAERLTKVMDRLAGAVGEGGRYVFDSPTAMLELWGGEERVLNFFSYLCPKLHDLGTLAYWITEKRAHSSSFLAKLLHATQVVLDLGVDQNGIEIVVRKASDRPRCRIGRPYYFASADGRPAATPQQREELEMSLLLEISVALGSSLNLRDVFESIMQALARGLQMKRGTLVLEDRAEGTLRIVAAHGLSAMEIERGVYQLGEGVTGAVVEKGRAVAVPDIRTDPRFLNRTGARRKDLSGAPISFVCVPLMIEDDVVGALSVDREFVDPETLEKDERLLQIVGSMISQAIRVNRMVGVEKEELLRAVSKRGAAESRYDLANVVGVSPRMRQALETTAKVARSNANVLLQGETGAGKELIARIIHSNSARRGRRLACVNCAALDATRLESELFGHVKGAFKGADRSRAGRFELADGGTIFLDEVDAVDAPLQAKLLRVVQEGEFQRMGSPEVIRTDVRVVAATNFDLARKVEVEQFREDLYYRLGVVRIDLPPLRERREDIAALAEHFMKAFSRANGKKVERLAPEALSLLMAHEWPGNVRELENCIERAVVLSAGSVLTPELLPESVRAGRRSRPQGLMRSPEEALLPLIVQMRRSAAGDLYDRVIGLVEQVLIEHVLEANGGVQTRAARELGMSRNTLRDRMTAYGLDA